MIVPQWAKQCLLWQHVNFAGTSHRVIRPRSGVLGVAEIRVAGTQKNRVIKGPVRYFSLE